MAALLALSTRARASGYEFGLYAGRPLLANVDGSRGVAAFASPSGVAIDAGGNLYVADYLNDTIRKITPAGVVTTVAGSPGATGTADGNGRAARFFLPFALTVDASGSVYVADTHSHTIRRITPAGDVSTWAGAPGVAGSDDGDRLSARFNLPAGVAVDRAGTTIYVADFGNNTVRAISLAGRATTLAGKAGEDGNVDGNGSAARFEYPTGVAVDAAGNVLLADPDTGLRRITPAGDVTTITGLTAASGPNGVAFGNDGSLYVAELYAQTVSRISPAGVATRLAGAFGVQGYADGNGGTALFHLPYSVAVDAFGNAYVADVLNCVIRKVTPAGTVTTFAGRGPSAGFADGMGSLAQFASPRGIAVDAGGTTYVADTFNHLIRKISRAGVVTTLAGMAGQEGHTDGTRTAASFAFPLGVAPDGAGNVYVADSGNSTIRKITPAGVVTTFAGSAGGSGYADGTGAAARFALPYGLAVDATGVVYVADELNSAIRRITPSGTVTTVAGKSGEQGDADGAGNVARFGQPAGIVVDGAGNLFVSDRSTFTIRKITPAGVVSTLAGQSGIAGTADGAGSAAQFASAAAIAIDRQGMLYVADGNDRIRQVTAGGTVTTLPGNAGPYTEIAPIDGVSKDYFTTGVAVDAAGNLYVADAANNSIRLAVPTIPRPEVSTASGAVTPVQGDRVTLMANSGVPLQWQRNGTALADGAGSATLVLDNLQPEQTGVYTYTVGGAGGGADLSEAAVVGLATTSKVVGGGTEVAHGVFVPANGNTFDQVLLTGPAASITAEPGKITRTSFVDLMNDIVQVEFSGAGTLSVDLNFFSGPAPAQNYNQPGVSYWKGLARIVITGADETTNVSVYTVGPLTAVNQSLFKPGVDYNGVAAIEYIAITSANGQFGGVRAANVTFAALDGFAGIYAPGVNFTGPVNVSHIAANEAATPVLLLGSTTGDTLVAGGSLLQPNGRAVLVSGVNRLVFTAGSTSHGVGDLPAQLNAARISQRSIDVTDLIVVDAAHPRAGSGQGGN